MLRRIAGLLFMGASFAAAQAAQTHSVALSWVDSVNPAGTAYNIYRAPGACPAANPNGVLPTTNTFVILNGAPVTAKVYGDSASTIQGGGSFCYLVSAVAINSTESIGNPLITVVVPTLFQTAPPTGLTTTSVK